MPARCARLKSPNRAANNRCRQLLLGGLCGWLLAVSPATVAQDQPQPTLPQITLRAGMHLIRAEVADTHESRMRGLMFRQHLALNAGMLFVFQHAERQCFWMKNTPLPLSIAFIADDGRIVNIAHMQPRSEDTHCSTEPVAFALEMERGWFASKGIKAGSRLQAPGVFRP